ncbi:hypothetical protein ACOSQ2_009304 [Xanthoceras sorbifolium]
MALISTPSSSSSSSTTPQINYDVFLSFRGEDTRYSFTSHLHKAFLDKQFEVFIDDKLNRGDEISPSLLEAIKESLISVIVFSKDYASSRWCLEELVKIIECREQYDQTVIPVFYGIDPTDVRNQTGSFADALAKHEQESLHEVQRWKDALNKAANLSGWHSTANKPESVLIDDIVEDVLKKLNDMSPSGNKNLVGIDSRIEHVESLLGRENVRSVGIWGIGGIGKTTLAGAVFDKISCQFEGSYFVHSVREASDKDLRRELYSAILGYENVNICTFLPTYVRKRFGRKKLLIIFDDVSDFRQIESLIGDPGCLSSRSRIIITSRDKQVLKNICREDGIYKVEDLCFNDALKLFCQYAFRQNRPKVEYRELSNGVVEKVGGVPLALKVFGSSLFDKRREVWESAMKKLENNFNKNIYEVLKISYDGLDDNEQSIFLDIACFFKGWDINLIKAFMDASGFFYDIGISVLIAKSLITKSDNKLTMHDLLQAMGKEIVRQQSTKDPEKRSRLWHHKDIYDILTKNMATEEIEGIFFNMSNIGDIHLHPQAFVKMHKLRFLRFYVSDYCENDRRNKVHVSQGLESFFTELIYLHWYGCPLKSLQSNFYSKNLVILEMPNSCLEELWSGVPQLYNLKSIDLGGSQQLIRCPDLSGAPNLESLMLTECTSLSEIPSSIQHLNKVQSLYLYHCKSLVSIPDCTSLKSLEYLFLDHCSKLKRLPQLPKNLKTLSSSECSSLVEIPSSVKHLSKLEYLNFSCCKSLTSIPDLRGLKSLKEFILRDTQVEELPSSLENLDSFVHIDLIDCSRLQSLPSSICKWKSVHGLYLTNCSKIDKLPDDIGTLESLQMFDARGTAIREVPPSISCLKRLHSLSFSGCKELPDTLGCLTSLRTLHLDRNNFESISGSIVNLSQLYSLDISYCERLKVLPELHGTTISAVNCTSLEVLSNFSFQNDIFVRHMKADFTNCFKLDRNVLNGVVKDTLLKLQGLAALVKKRHYHQVYEGVSPPVYICYPESEIPEWFSYQSKGSFIDVKLPPYWLDYKFLCFAVCVVVSVPYPNHQRDHHGDDNYSSYSNIIFECNVKSRDGDRRVVIEYGNHRSLRVAYSGFDYIRSNHLFIGFGFHFFRELCDTEFSFRFYVKNENELNTEYCKVEKCGVHFMFAQHLEDEPHSDEIECLEASDESSDQEEDETTQKRLKQIECDRGETQLIKVNKLLLRMS